VNVGGGYWSPRVENFVKYCSVAAVFYPAVATVPVKVNFGKEQYTMVHPVIPGLVIVGNWVGAEAPKVEQEGQHPLTGQRAANFAVITGSFPTISFERQCPSQTSRSTKYL